LAVPEPVEQPGAAPAYVVPGSQEWLEEDKNKLVGPPTEDAMASAGLAQYEAGKVAYQLDRYLKVGPNHSLSPTHSQFIMCIVWTFGLGFFWLCVCVGFWVFAACFWRQQIDFKV